jgi:hypothetical protein
VEIYDWNERVWVYGFDRFTGTSFTPPGGVLQLDTPYQYRVQAGDGDTFTNEKNRSRSDFLGFYTGNPQATSFNYLGVRSDNRANEDMRLTMGVGVSLGELPTGVQLRVTSPNNSIDHVLDESNLWYGKLYGYEYWTGQYIPTPQDDTITYSLTTSEWPSPPPDDRSFIYSPVPIVDIGTLMVNDVSLASNAYLDSTTPTFEWGEITLTAGIPHYRLEIHDWRDQGYFYVTPRSTTPSVTVPSDVLLPGSSYRARIRTTDDSSADSEDNISRSDYFFFTVQDDSDGDGDLDGYDNCPNDSNPNQLDSDFDGVGDVCDNCPDDSNPGQENTGWPQNATGDACEDSDSDGISDLDDNCPSVPNPSQLDWDQDDIGDVCEDSDYDGLLDSVDAFPFDPDDDLDGDGIGADPLDICGILGGACGEVDNCSMIPNGPNLGTCTAGNVGVSCTSDGDCGTGGYCSMNQEDDDVDGIGDACESAGTVSDEPKCNPRKEPCGTEDMVTDTDDDQLADDQEPSGCVGLQDCDGDGVIDGSDNCIGPDAFHQNPGQTDTDNDDQGDACDPDDDNDTVADGNDNCRLVSNADQSNIDGDPDGDACDDDIDGDDLLNDEEVALGTSPTNPDTDGDGLPDNSDPDPLNPAGAENYTIVLEAREGAANVTDTWLPAPLSPTYPQQSTPTIPSVYQSSQVTVVATFKNPDGDPTPFTSDVTFTLSPSTWEGVATNDTELYVGTPSNDFSFDPDDKTVLNQTVAAGPVPEEASVTLYTFDYGGQATIMVTTTDPDGNSVEGTTTLPLDSDKDLLPDVWENDISGFNAYNAKSFSAAIDDGQEDLDTSASNTYIGDGLTNFLEYRGIILDDAFGAFTEHIRLDPWKKNLFVRGDNFQNSIPPNTAPDVLNFSVVVPGGSAFENAGMVVHDVTGLLSFSGPAEPPNIDILVVTNNTTETTTIAGYANGYTNHLGSRYWTWDTKGASYIGNFQFYQLNSSTGAQGTYLYHLNLMHYFYNRPYWDNPDALNESEYLGLLDPLNLVEDYRQENGIGPERIKGKSEDRFDTNGVLDGDHMETDWKSVSWGPESYMMGYEFSCFDADGDGLIENPVVVDAKTISKEYSAEEVQLHTAIHEMGHAVGIVEHTTDPLCVMYEASQNWDRAGHFCDYAASQIMIHNKTE